MCLAATACAPLEGQQQLLEHVSLLQGVQHCPNNAYSCTLLHGMHAPSSFWSAHQLVTLCMHRTLAPVLKLLTANITSSLALLGPTPQIPAQYGCTSVVTMTSNETRPSTLAHRGAARLLIMGRGNLRRALTGALRSAARTSSTGEPQLVKLWDVTGQNGAARVLLPMRSLLGRFLSNAYKPRPYHP